MRSAEPRRWKTQVGREFIVRFREPTGQPIQSITHHSTTASTEAPSCAMQLSSAKKCYKIESGIFPGLDIRLAFRDSTVHGLPGL